jgi:hypothetical protein
MMIKIAACLLAVSFLAACESTKPAPPAEGPEDVPANRPMDPIENPALVPSPLLRANAIGNP